MSVMDIFQQPVKLSTLLWLQRQLKNRLVLPPDYLLIATDGSEPRCSMTVRHLEFTLICDVELLAMILAVNKIHLSFTIIFIIYISLSLAQSADAGFESPNY